MSEISVVSKSKIEEKIKELQDLHPIKINCPEEIEEILNLNRYQLKTTATDDLYINAIKLAQYSLYIKRDINKAKAVLSWCEANINSIIGRELNNTNGYGLGEKSLIIKRSDNVAKEIEAVRINFAVKLNQLEDTDRKIEFISNAIKNLAAERRYSTNER